MRRLFWVAVGAGGAVMAADRLRKAARRYTPAGVGEQVDAASRATSSALHEAVDRFTTAMAAREKELVAALLVTPEGGDPGAVLGRRGAERHTQDRDAGPWAQDATRSRRTSSGPSGRVDDDDSLYDF